MAEQPPGIEFEDIPLEQARHMGRGPRMEPMLYDTLRKKIQSLSDDAIRIRLGPEITDGVIFWRSSDEDRHQAQEVASRLQGARHKRSRPRGGRRRE